MALKERLDNEIYELEVKARRKRKERLLALKRLRELGDREARNILELEEDERCAESERLEHEHSEVAASSSVAPVGDFDWCSMSPGAEAAFLAQFEQSPDVPVGTSETGSGAGGP